MSSIFYRRTVSRSATDTSTFHHEYTLPSTTFCPSYWLLGVNLNLLFHTPVIFFSYEFSLFERTTIIPSVHKVKATSCHCRFIRTILHRKWNLLVGSSDVVLPNEILSSGVHCLDGTSMPLNPAVSLSSRAISLHNFK